MELWTTIVQSNTFNFLVMIALFAFIIKKFNLSEKLEEAISKVKETIDESENAKNNSIKELEQASEKTKNVQAEVEEIEQKADENIINSKNKIALNCEEQIASIKKSAEKIIDAKEKELASRLSKKTVLASLEIARKHIVNLLNQNPAYHKEFIEKSIEELNRLK